MCNVMCCEVANEPVINAAVIGSSLPESAMSNGVVWGDNITNNRIMTCDNVHHKQAGTLVWGVSDGTKTKPGGQSEAQSGRV